MMSLLILEKAAKASGDVIDKLSTPIGRLLQ